MLDQKLQLLRDQLYTTVLPKDFSQKLSPTTISIIAFVAGVASIFSIITEAYLLGLIFWLLNRFIEGINEFYFRRYRNQSNLSIFLGTNLDLIIYAGIIVAFAFTASPALLHVSLALILVSLFYINIGQLFIVSTILDRQAQEHGMHTTTMPKSFVKGSATFFIYTICFLVPKSIALVWLVFIVLMLGNITHRFLWTKKNNA